MVSVTGEFEQRYKLVRFVMDSKQLLLEVRRNTGVAYHARL